MVIADRKPFAADIFGVKQVGLSAWRSAYEWPVPWRAYLTFSDHQWDLLDTAYASLGPLDREGLAATCHAIGWIREVTHASAVRAWCEERGRKLLTSDLSQPFYAPNWRSALDQFRAVRRSNPWKMAAGGFSRRYLDARSLSVGSRLRSLAGGADTWNVGIIHGLKADWLAQNDTAIRSVYAAALMKGAVDLPPVASRPLADAISALLTDMAQRARELIGHHPDIAACRDVWIEAAGRVRAAIDHIRRTSRPPRQLLFSGPGSLAHRVLGIAYSGMGTRTITFNHGHEVSHVLQRHAGYTLYLPYDEYVCETDASAAGHSDQYSLAGVSREKPVRFSSVNTPIYRNMYAEPPPPQACDPPRVMLLGYPHNARRNQYDVTDFFAFHLELECRLLERLKSMGMRTIYKTHPDRAREAQDVFEALADEVITEPFEQVIDSADAYLFATTITSTFGLAMCTRRPVIVLDVEGKRWNPRFREIIARRCRLVPSGLDDNNRFWFDEGSFDQAHQFPGPVPDFGFVHDVLSPQRDN